jgi:hypothetical protein
MIKQSGMKISLHKSNIMAFAGQVPIGSKIVVLNTSLEKVNIFAYFRCKISYKQGKGKTAKLFFSFTNIWNSEQCFVMIFSPKTILIESV